jgi:hypothetical protein
MQDLEGAFDANGQVTAWRHHMWIPTEDTHLIAAELIGKPDVVGITGRGARDDRTAQDQLITSDRYFH